MSPVERSAKLGDLRVTRTLTAGVGGTSFMASSAERSAEVSTRGSHISGYGSDLAALFGSGSGSNSVIT